MLILILVSLTLIAFIEMTWGVLSSWALPARIGCSYFSPLQNQIFENHFSMFMNLNTIHVLAMLQNSMRGGGRRRLFVSKASTCENISSQIIL